jgi:aryl sulfotransferase
MNYQISSDRLFPGRERAVIKDYLRDSTIWDGINPRPDDIVIASCYKSGTTLTQQIVNLMVNGHDDFEYLHDLSPWVEHVGDPLNEKIERIEKLPHRRFFKTHLPFEALPYHPTWKYICLVRDGRDVGMSLFNHVHALTEEAQRNSPVKLHKPAADFGNFWDEWIETGKPYWDFFEFINSWWWVRHFPNVLLVHYADLLHHKPAQIEKIADFLKIELDSHQKDMILYKSSLEYMKQESNKFDHRDFEKHRFIYKGTNGRWPNLLRERQLKRYDYLLARNLAPDCANWVKHGGNLLWARE